MSDRATQKRAGGRVTVTSDAGGPNIVTVWVADTLGAILPPAVAGVVLHEMVFASETAEPGTLPLIVVEIDVPRPAAAHVLGKDGVTINAVRRLANMIGYWGGHAVDLRVRAPQLAGREGA